MPWWTSPPRDRAAPAVVMVGFFVAATLVTLVQFFRLRDRRLLALLALFVLLALAHSRPPGDAWGRRYHMAAGTSGLALLVLLSPRPVRR